MPTAPRRSNSTSASPRATSCSGSTRPPKRATRPAASRSRSATFLCSNSRGLELVRAHSAVALDREDDQALAEFRVGDAGRLPELRVDAGLGEAGHGVDLVDQDPAVRLDEEVAAGETGRAGAREGLARQR